MKKLFFILGPRFHLEQVPTPVELHLELLRTGLHTSANNGTLNLELTPDLT